MSVQDAVLAAALGVLALLVRLPDFGDVPGFTDEMLDVIQAVGIVRGEHFPLSHEYGASYAGAWHSYLVAVSLLLGGMDVSAARAVTLLLGVLTVVTTYLLARELRLGRPEAAAAALVLLASGTHIVLGSRVVWAPCTVPFYTTLAALLVHRTIRLRTPGSALGAGLVAGLGISAHPFAIVVLLPLTAWFVWKARTQYRNVAIAMVGGAVALSPLVLYNLQSGFGSLRDAAAIGGAYQDAAGHPSYLTNLGAMAVELGQLVTSDFGSATAALTDPMLYLAYGLSLVGVIWFLTRGLWWPPLAIATMALVMPLVVPRYGIVMDGRYILPVLPLLLIGAAGAVGLAGRLASARSSVSSGPGLLMAAVTAVVITVLVGVMTLVPLQRLRLYEAQTLPYNAMLRELADDIESVRSAGEPVLIDRELQLEYQPQFPVSVGRGKVLEMLFALEGIPHRFVEITPAGVHALTAELDTPSAVLVTLPGRDAGLTSFDRLSVGETPLISDQEVAVYRVTRTPVGSNDDGFEAVATP
jgi:4-amino-4-deoxy-L-arabinose transferase-like glycosyltransferase